VTDLPDVIVITDDQSSSVITVEVPSDTPDVITVEIPTGAPDVITIDTGWQGPTGKTIETASWTYMGTITVRTGDGAWVYPGDYLLRTVQLSIASPPVGADVIVDVNVNGMSVFADQSQRPRILAGSNTDLVDFPANTAVGLNDIITVDIDQVGSVSPGSTLVAIVRAEEV